MATDLLIDELVDGATTTVGTDYVWAGTGVLDKLIETFNANIKIQYDNGRLNSTDFAQVYLGGYQATLNQASQIWLSEKEIEARIDLIKAQLDTEILQQSQLQAQTALANRQVAKIEDDIRLAELDRIDRELTTAKQRLAIDKDIELKDTNISSINRDIAVKEKQIDIMERDQSNKDEQSAKDLEIKTAQVSKVNRDVSLTEEQIKMTISQKDEVLAATVRNDNMSFAQVLKTETDTAFIDKKIETETESTINTIAQRAIIEADAAIKEFQRSDMLPKQSNLLDAQLDEVNEGIRETSSKIAVIDQQKEQADLENPSKLIMVQEQASAAGYQSDMALNQLEQFIASRGKMLNKLDAEVSALNTATAKVMKEIQILMSQYQAMEDRRPKDLSMLDAQIAKLIAEGDMVIEQQSQLVSSVEDNRLIRALQAQADMLNGITMAKLQPTDDMVYEFYKLVNQLGGSFDTAVGDTTLNPTATS